MRRTTNKKNSKLTSIIIISAMALLAISVSAYVIYKYTSNDEIKRDKNGISTERTSQDKQLERVLEDNPGDKEDNTQTDTPKAPIVDESTKLQQVNVILTNTGESNGEVSASGFVSNIVESNGACEYVFSKDAKAITKTSATLVNANSTTCATIRFEASELSVGEWKVLLKYKSLTSQGVSNELKVNIK